MIDFVDEQCENRDRVRQIDEWASVGFQQTFAEQTVFSATHLRDYVWDAIAVYMTNSDLMDIFMEAVDFDTLEETLRPKFEEYVVKWNEERRAEEEAEAAETAAQK